MSKSPKRTLLVKSVKVIRSVFPYIYRLDSSDLVVTDCHWDPQRRTYRYRSSNDWSCSRRFRQESRVCLPTQAIRKGRWRVPGNGFPVRRSGYWDWSSTALDLQCRETQGMSSSLAKLSMLTSSVCRRKEGRSQRKRPWPSTMLLLSHRRPLDLPSSGLVARDSFARLALKSTGETPRSVPSTKVQTTSSLRLLLSFCVRIIESVSSCTWRMALISFNNNRQGVSEVKFGTVVFVTK